MQSKLKKYSKKPFKNPTIFPVFLSFFPRLCLQIVRTSFNPDRNPICGFNRSSRPSHVNHQTPFNARVCIPSNHCLLCPVQIVSVISCRLANITKKKQPTNTIPNSFRSAAFVANEQRARVEQVPHTRAA